MVPWTSTGVFALLSQDFTGEALNFETSFPTETQMVKASTTIDYRRFTLSKTENLKMLSKRSMEVSANVISSVHDMEQEKYLERNSGAGISRIIIKEHDSGKHSDLHTKWLNSLAYEQS